MAREAIAAATAGTAVTSALGCPHGRYNDKVIAGAHGVGIKLVFTSDTLLNRTQGEMLALRSVRTGGNDSDRASVRAGSARSRAGSPMVMGSRMPIAMLSKLTALRVDRCC